MPLNYSKWDALEVSDDSDIEGHPNVDHRSLVNWKRRDIHEKRAMRNHKIIALKAEIKTNDVLLPRLHAIASDVEENGPAKFSSYVEQLKTNPSPAGPEPEPGMEFEPPAPGGKKLTYDEMILSLLLKVYDDAREKGVAKGSENQEKLREALVANLREHEKKLGERQETCKKDLAQEEREKAKKITSEDIHDGFDSGHVTHSSEPQSLYKGKTKTSKVDDIEVLNPKAVENAQIAQLASKASAEPKEGDVVDAGNDDVVDEVPEMTPILEEFSKLPIGGYEKSWEFIQKHRDVYVPGASDALFVAAFRAQRTGNVVRAKQCVHQSMLLQYCEKLGPDGPRLFFARMMKGEPRAEKVFVDDFESTYQRLAERTKEMLAEEASEGGQGGKEQIQIVAEGGNDSVGFDIPDGPPPEEIKLGEGLEGVDVEDVRRALQLRWEVYEGLPEAMKAALAKQSLDEVNKVLARMDLEEAENMVGLLDKASIIRFSEHGIRDATEENVD